MICYRGLKFPQRAVVLLPLERDAACTSLNGHSAWKSAFLDLVWCYKARGDREQDLWKYWLPEGCIKHWYDKPTGDGCFCKKCGLGDKWKIDTPVSHTLSNCTDVQCANTRFRYWFTPLTRLSIYTTDNCLLPLLFLTSLSILSCCPVINICSFLQDMKLSWIGPMTFHPYTGFHYSVLLNYLSYDCSNFSNISGMECSGSLPWMIWCR